MSEMPGQRIVKPEFNQTQPPEPPRPPEGTFPWTAVVLVFSILVFITGALIFSQISGDGIVTPTPSATPLSGDSAAAGDLLAPPLDRDAGLVRDIPDSVSAIVLQVFGTDTLEVSLNGRMERISYRDVHGPAPDSPCFDVAAAWHSALLSGKTVELVAEPSAADTGDERRRYVYLDGILINAEMVRQGFALPDLQADQTSLQNALLELQAQAAENRLGCYLLGDAVTAFNAVPGGDLEGG